MKTCHPTERRITTSVFDESGRRLRCGEIADLLNHRDKIMPDTLKDSLQADNGKWVLPEGIPGMPRSDWRIFLTIVITIVACIVPVIIGVIFKFAPKDMADYYAGSLTMMCVAMGGGIIAIWCDYATKTENATKRAAHQLTKT